MYKFKVSVVVLTYNHDKYIQKALDSILMQKVDFPYEVIVGDDNSPDNTRSILNDYQKKYPQIFTMIYREINLGAQKNVQDLYLRCTGMYIAYLEGDDYWTSENKLQKQVDFLDSNPDYIACSHKVRVVDEHSNEIFTTKYPHISKKNYTFSHYKKGLLPGQSAAIVCHNIYNRINYDRSLFHKVDLEPGDRIKAFVLLCYGKIYFFHETMSAYRYITNSGTSYSATVKNKKDINHLKKINFYREILDYSYKINNKRSIIVAESLYIFTLMRYSKKAGLNSKFTAIEYKKIRYKIHTLLFLFNRVISWPLRKIKFLHYGKI
jgi:glycosyltransferase involved in cell wall biosynthesis